MLAIGLPFSFSPGRRLGIPLPGRGVVPGVPGRVVGAGEVPGLPGFTAGLFETNSSSLLILFFFIVDFVF
jgi:hypothetical protein